MSEQKGMLLTCDRCGETTFLQYLGQDVLDGGFTRIGKYEDRPPEWLYMSETGHLCPSCSVIFKKFVTEFMSGRVAPIWKYEGPMEG